MKSVIIFLLALFSIQLAISQTYISRQQATEDLDHYNKTLQEVHYNPFLYVDRETYFNKVEALKANLPDSIKTEDFILSLHKLAALKEDSHSYPGVFQAELFKEAYEQEGFFPFTTTVYENRLYVPYASGTAFGIPAGAEITSINGTDAAALVTKFQNYIGGLPAYRSEMAARFLPHFLFLNGIKAPFEIAYTKTNGEKGNSVLEKGVPYIKSLITTMPNLAEGNTYKIAGPGVGYIDFKNMSGDWQDLSKLLDSAFADFRKNNVAHLVIDLRNNSGGNSMMGEVLFGYITDKKFALMGGKKWKVSDAYKASLTANGNTGHEYLKQETGTIWELGDCNPQPSRMQTDEKFSGEVYMLTGPFTFSSGNMVADAAKQYGLAELVGEPTGETTNDFGEVFTFRLPNSRILMNTTTSFDLGTACDSSIHSPVIPDVLIPKELSDIATGRDRALEYVLEKARKVE